MSMANWGSSPEPSGLTAGLAGDTTDPFSTGRLVGDGLWPASNDRGLPGRVTPGMTGRFLGGVRATGELRMCIRKLRS